MTFAEAIKSYRKENKLTMQKMAEEVKTTRQRISDWEHEEANPSVVHLKNLMVVLGEETILECLR